MPFSKFQGSLIGFVQMPFSFGNDFLSLWREDVNA